MSHLRIFVSLEFDKDNDLRNNFYRQGKEHSAHIIHDSSLRHSYPSKEWKARARSAICGCDVVVVLVGADTHYAPGIRTEIEIASHFGKPIFQIVPQGRPYQGVPCVDERIRWKWTTINRRLDETATSR